MSKQLPEWNAEEIAEAWLAAEHVPQVVQYSDLYSYNTQMGYWFYKAELHRQFYRVAIEKQVCVSKEDGLEPPSWKDIFSQLSRGRLVVASDANTRFRERHPLNEPGGHNRHRREFSYNEMGRAVHDYYGHWLHRTAIGYSVEDPFSFEGECQAFIMQAASTRREAWPVLFAEVVGQRAVLEVTGQFPVQKACTLPAKFLRDFDPFGYG